MSLFEKVKSYVPFFGAKLVSDKAGPLKAERLDIIKSLECAQTFQDSLTVIERMWAFENTYLRRESFNSVEFYWSIDLPQSTLLRITNMIKNQLLIADLGVDHLIVIVGLLMRLRQPSQQELAKLVEMIGLGMPRFNNATNYWREFLVALYASRHFALLEEWVPIVIKNEVLGVTDRQLFCDYLVHATYFSLQQKISLESLSDADIAKIGNVLALCKGCLKSGDARLEHYCAVMAAVRGDIDGAVEAHIKALQSPVRLTPFFQSASNVVCLDKIRGYANQIISKEELSTTLGSELQFIERHPMEGSCFLVACDEGYFQTFFQGYADSFAWHNKQGLIHIHAINFNPDISEIDALEQRFNIRINITLDKVGICKEDSLWLGYCAGARFLYMPLYLQKYQRVVATDIDGILNFSEQDVWDGNEVNILLRSTALGSDVKHYRALWLNIAAGAVGLTNNASHQQFARALSLYLVERYKQTKKHGGKFFFSDQTGLFLCFWVLRDECTFAMMPGVFEQDHQVSNAGRWEAKKRWQMKAMENLRNGIWIHDQGI